ncbi:MAG: hypothetical protein C0501_08260 [Isosphaera sp.]|nr:hypothetical protein [Isosphaera sp.]
MRAACAGLGAVLCAGAVGCNTVDKDAPPKLGGPQTGKQVGPGLPGTPTLPGSQGVGQINRAPSGSGIGGPSQPGGFITGVQPSGGFGQPAGRVNQPGPATGAGGTLIPDVRPGGQSSALTGGYGPMTPPNMSGPHAAPHTTAGGTGHTFTPPPLTDPGFVPPARPDAPAMPVAPPKPGMSVSPGLFGGPGG